MRCASWGGLCAVVKTTWPQRRAVAVVRERVLRGCSVVVTTCNTVTVSSYLSSLTLQLLDERPGHAGAAGVEDNVSLWGGMEMGVGDLSGGRTTSPEGCWEKV